MVELYLLNRDIKYSNGVRYLVNEPSDVPGIQISILPLNHIVPADRCLGIRLKNHKQTFRISVAILKQTISITGVCEEKSDTLMKTKAIISLK